METNKNKNLYEKSVQATNSSSLLEVNHLYTYMYKKAEKLASALYMVTNFIPEGELLRGLLREKSIGIFSGVMQLQKMSIKGEHVLRTGDGTKEDYTSLDSILSNITEIVSLFEIAHISGYVSEMNFIILKREYLNLGMLIKERKDDIVSGDVNLSKEFFDVLDLYETHMLGQGAIKKDMSLKSNKNIKRENFANINRTKIIRNYSEKDIKGETNIKFDKKIKIYPKTTDIKHSSRKNTILELLQNKPFVTVKDVTNAIQGYSGKTLQRELLSLVKEGILKKKGERRWSTYSLA